ncbi:ABC transporter substrate-binding protein [Achromobacter insolitus]|uniref:Bug family tripartite tricarboxylate transporter substrate binding protein n=1 Tax=Achromobacter insolitus TaxID=217204 RepID=UPI0007C87902|nr:tripartite tricarboxylate transporter substrate binding protein [Achromobacter insolitus]OAE54104.1 ABC transporter substrate-binding protein [Achromobacter insolitus]OCZ59372.1 ABC transporter substrate-binding protein [Achromobacter insolitus]
MNKGLRRWTAALLGVVIPAAVAWAGPYPDQPIRLIAPFGAGGVTDTTARVFAEGLTRELGQPVVVENRGGAGGSIAAGAVAKSPADGYTLLVITNGMVAVNPLIYKKLPYDPNKDFTYVAMLANTPTVLAVGAESPYASLPDIIKAASAQADKIAFSTAGEGSDNYQVLELLQQATGVKMLHVPYKSGSESMTAVMSRNTDLTAVSAVTAVGFVEAKQIRPFAVTSSRRLPNLPDVPTVKEVLGKDVEGGSLSGIAVPKGTPVEVVARLNAAIAAVAKSASVRDKIYARGSEPVDGAQEAFERKVVTEQKKWADILSRPAQ